MRPARRPQAADDAGRRVTIPPLIPGATCHIEVLWAGVGILFEKEFRAEVGKATRLELVTPGAK